MNRKVKLLWDFRGPEAMKIAEHHETHLREFIRNHKITDYNLTGSEKISEMHAVAFWVIPETEIMTYRDVLKPHRATLYSEE